MERKGTQMSQAIIEEKEVTPDKDETPKKQQES